MAFARDTQVSIERLSQLGNAQIELLHRAYITSVEGLVGQLEADPDAIGDLLGLDPSGVKKLAEEAMGLLPVETQDQLARLGKTRYSYGALNPHED